VRSKIKTFKPEHFYDVLAPYYRDFCRTKSDYLDAVDLLVIDHIFSGAASLIDVGAGDGLRAEHIAQACGLPVLILVEPCERMAAYCQQRKATEVWRVKAEELMASDRRFDVIICLWNVLGHVPDNASRLAALRRMSSLLTENGRIFLDVNNRYNARAYGWLKTCTRVLYDLLKPSPANGDVTFNWSVDGIVIQARGHVFTPREIGRLISQAGLSVERRFIVDYQSGRLRRFVIEGQLLFELRLRK
jgi:2-polyprenyl-3-methyl-5-hydroxy-6-metoxy-1,4-benzoquinol methylase